MKLGIMQPYLFPYIGYYQLIKIVDTFVIYDNIQYIKGGWVNRNRLILNGKVQMFTVPLANASNYLDIKDRYISNDSNGKKTINKIISQIENSYRKYPYFNNVFPLVEKTLTYKNNNLFDFLYFSIQSILDYLGIKTTIKISSELDIDHTLKHQDRVISICNNMKSKTYINSIGGLSLYNNESFKSSGIDLLFIKSLLKINDLDHSLSIIDLLMEYSKKEINQMLNKYELMKND